MGLIYGTSTVLSASSASSSVLELSSPDLSYIVVLLLVLCALIAIDLVRRIFIRR